MEHCNTQSWIHSKFFEVALLVDTPNVSVGRTQSVNCHNMLVALEELLVSVENSCHTLHSARNTLRGDIGWLARVV